MCKPASFNTNRFCFVISLLTVSANLSIYIIQIHQLLVCEAAVLFCGDMFFHFINLIFFPFTLHSLLLFSYRLPIILLVFCICSHILCRSRGFDFIYIFHSVLFFNKFIYLFIYFWLHWVFIAAHGLSLVAASGGYSSLWCMGFSLQWLVLWSTGSRCAGFSSCGTWTQ